MFFKALVIFSYLLSKVIILNAQSTNLPTTTLKQELNTYLQKAVPFGFSGQVVIEKYGKVIFSNAYGFADRFHHIKMTDETVMGIASMSKQFCATAIMKLKDEQKLTLEDSLSEFFPDIPRDKANITIHQLLTHTSGLSRRKSSDFEIVDKEDMIRDIFSTPLDFKPGTDWRYAPAGYSVAAMIVEKVTGIPYKEFLEKFLIAPAHLEHTFYEEGPYPQSTQLAHSYVGWTDHLTPRVWPRNFRNYGAGDLFSTAIDLHKWIKALESGKIISKSSLGAMWSPQSHLKNRPNYGYGWFIHANASDTIIEHGGDAALGYNGGIIMHRDKHFKIFITTNARTRDGDYIRHAVTRDLEQIMLGKSNEITRRSQRELAEPGQLNRLPGTYGLDKDDKMHIISDGSYLWVAAEGQQAVSLFIHPDNESKNDFRRANEKTQSLLHALWLKKPDAYKKFVPQQDGQHEIPYKTEWNSLVNALGPLHRFKIRGSSPFYDDVETIVKLFFRDTSIEMSYLWSDHAKGPLRGTAKFDRIDYPVAQLLTPMNDSTFNAQGLFKKDSLLLSISKMEVAESLCIKIKSKKSTYTLNKVGLAGWESDK